MKLTIADVQAAQKELCKRSLAYFAQQAWHVLEPTTELKWGWALDAICEHLQAVTDGRINRLLMNVPPGPMRWDSKVETSEGVKLLRDVQVGDMVLTHKGRYRRVSEHHDQGVLPILAIKTHSGRITHAAPSHPYLTPNGWVKAGDLNAGDVLAVVNRSEDRPAPAQCSNEAARFLGYIVGDGSVTHSPGFTNGDSDVIADFVRCSESLGFKCRVRKVRNAQIVGLTGAREFLAEHGLLGADSYTKRIPVAVMNGSIDAIKNFMGAYWACDGGIDVRNSRTRGSAYRAYATTVSEGMADDLVLALGFIGIEARKREKVRALETKSQPGGLYKSYSIEVQRETMTARVVALPALGERKKKAGEGCRTDFDSPLWCDPIESITEIEAAHCYCLTVEEDHSFTCSGVAVHNCMKSLLTSVIWPAWEWGPRGMPELRYLGTAHNADLAIRDTRKCRDLIKSEWYQSRWPIEIKRDQDGKTEFGNTRQGFRQAKAFTSMTGIRGDRVILDDPIGAYDANSAAALEEARLAFTETLPTRVNNEKSAIVVIMQRLNEADTSGLILDMGLPYVHLCIPMEYESANDAGPNELGWKDPRTHDGELMFPERYSLEYLAELKKSLGPYGTAGQLQQSPSPRGGGIIKSEWFGEWQQLPPLEWLAITADTAQKTGQENDYSVLQLWGRSTTGQAVFVDQLRGKWEAPELLEKTRSFWLKSKGQYPNLRAIYIEDKASGIGLVQTLRREGVPVLPIARNAGRDKVARANDSVPFMASGNVILPAYAGWVSGFLAEVERFPKGAHDDQLDPMFDAIQLVQQIPAQQNDWATAQLPNRRYVR